MTTTPASATRADHEKTPALPRVMPMQYRFEALDLRPHLVRAEEGAEEKPEPDAYDIVLTTDRPLRKYGWFENRGYCEFLEILGHEPGEVDLSFAKDGISFMLEHGGSMRSFSPDPDFHLGMLEEFEVKGGKLHAVARFAENDALSDKALRVKRDWASGKPTRRFMSGGWAPVRRMIVEPAKDGGLLTVRHIQWQIREGSNVSIPADPVAGKKRSADLELFEVEDGPPAITHHRSQEETTMTQTTTTTPPAPAAAPATAAGVAVGDDAMKARNAEVSQIVQLCVAQKVPARAHEFIEAGLTLSEVKNKLFDELSARNAATRTRFVPGEAIDDRSERERKRHRYSLRRAARMSLNRRSGKFEGLEGEWHDELMKRKPEEMKMRGGILIPFDTRSEDEIEEAWEREVEHRTMDTKTPAKGAEWVPDQPMQLVEFLEAKTILARLGANFNAGLVGNPSYPRETGQPSVVFAGENPGTNVTPTDAATGEIMSGPKQTIGSTKLSRMWLFQTGGVGEARIRRALVNGTARAYDRAGFHGTGAGSQPTGLYSLLISGVQSEPMANVAPTIERIVSMGGKIGDQNADEGRMAFALSRRLAWFLRGKLEFAAAGAQTIFTGPIDAGMIAGYPAIGSTQIRKDMGAGSDEHGFILGNWEYCDVNMWGATELVVDELTYGDQALVAIRSYGMGDVVFTHPEAFCIGTAAKAA